MAPVFIIYPTSGPIHIRNHAAPSQEIADAVIEYVRAKYRTEPEETIPMKAITLDPGGMSRMDHEWNLHTAPSGVTYRVKLCHVREIVATLQGCRKRPGTLYGSTEEVYRFGDYYLTLIPVSDVDSLETWLASMLAEADQEEDVAWAKIMEAQEKGREHVIPPVRQMNRYNKPHS